MTTVYEFEKIPFKKQNNYIFQFVQDRKLTDIEHLHDFYELIWFVRGNAVHSVNGEARQERAETVVLLRPTDRHFFLSQSEDVGVVSLSIKREEFERFSNVFDVNLLSCVQRERVPKSLAFSPSVSMETFSVTEYGCKLLLSTFLKGYIEETGCLQTGKGLPPMLAFAVEEMKKTEYLRRGIEAFTELSHYSQSHLSRLVKKYFGMSLKGYINELRLQSAYNEIILTRKSTEEICEEVGFASFSHFNKIFKARFSVTPAALRKGKGVWTA